jgi:hypothetical protein
MYDHAISFPSRHQRLEFGDSIERRISFSDQGGDILSLLYFFVELTLV